ncbi:MAG: hypothetical protein LUG95_09475, partial [Clostridiales bacterium]|nr:hypothetical protein [Clostridiales bacterium]
MSAKFIYPIKTPKKFFIIFSKFFKKISELRLKLQGIIYFGRFESFKIMHTSKGFLTAVIFLLVIVFSFNTNSLTFSSTELFLNDFYEQYGGELDSEVYEIIDEMKKQVQTVEAEFNAESERYAKGEITLDEYELARAKNEAYDTQR